MGYIANPDIAAVSASRYRRIGASAIRSVLALAARDNMPVSLQVLKVNPAQHLYAKLGFYIVSETTSAYHMRADT